MGAIASNAVSKTWIAQAADAWVGGIAPTENDTCTIESGANIEIDGNITVGNDDATAAIEVKTGGRLFVPSTVAAAYTLTLKGNLVHTAGTFELGTSANPIPLANKFTVKLNYSASQADGKYGFTSTAGTLTLQGATRTVDRTWLAADAIATATALTVADSTGWLPGDQIAIAPTSQTRAECEVRIVDTVVGTTVNITVGLTYAHSGTSPTQADIINLTRGVKITNYTFSTTAASNYAGYINIKDAVAADIDWVEFEGLGTTTTGKRGIEIETSTGSLDMQRCALHDFEANAIYTVGATLNNVTVSNNVAWNSPYSGGTRTIHLCQTSNSWTASGNIVMSAASAACKGFYVGDLGSVFTNNTAVGCLGYGFDITPGVEATGLAPITGTISGNTAHSNTLNGFQFANGTGIAGGTVSTTTSWRNANAGIGFGSSGTGPFDVTFEDAVVFGNYDRNIRLNGAAVVTFKRLISNGDTTFACSGIDLNGGRCPVLTLIDCEFSQVAGIKTAHGQDIYCGWDSPTWCDIRAFNCKWGTNPVGYPERLSGTATIRSMRHDQTKLLYYTWKRDGKISRDAVIFKTALPSERITPTSATNKMESGRKVKAVADAGTVTFSVWVRKSEAADAGGADYNGSQPRLVIKANYAVGMAADLVLDTMTEAIGTWELLTGTSAAVTDAGALEAVVDCDGTAGWINVDDWSVTTA